ncbi:OsmC family protein [Salirhabdus euzebyi]|uniref:OsmC family protein n=1 Tax=Salirhabdus euzebyi TaxID=394506 RepID=UPI00157AACAE
MEARQIPTFPSKLTGSFKGIIEAVDGVLRITKIECHYELVIPQGKREAAERALNVFEKGCPVAQTLKGCVQFDHQWTIEEEE